MRAGQAAKATVGWLRQAVNLELRSRGFDSLSRYTHPGWCEAEQVQVGKPDSRKGQPDETEARNQRHHPLSL